jgi:hypothetical protein
MPFCACIGDDLAQIGFKFFAEQIGSIEFPH